MTALIALTRGLSAMVDDESFDKLSCFSWCARVSDGRPYAVTHDATSGKIVYMHRLIINAAEGDIVDHIDGNSLNNKVANLRLCTTSQNAMNGKSHKDSKSRFKGIFPNGKSGKPWVAQICKDRIKHHLGVFDTEEQAARAYDDAARKLFGVFAKPNFEE